MINKNKHLIKIAIIILVIFAAVSLVILYSQNLKKAKLKTAEKFSNIETEIFGGNGSKNEEQQKRIEEISEVYSLTVRNQIEIDNLRGEISDLKKQITVYGNQENFSKVIFSYYDLRQKIVASHDYKNQLESFKLLAIFDVNLKSRAAALEEVLIKAKSPKEIEKEFKTLIPQFIRLRKNETDTNIFAQIKSSILNSIIIRRVDETKAQQIDKIILLLEKLLENQSYLQAYEVMQKLPPEYKNISQDFIKNLNNLVTLQELDKSILSYLKGLI